MNWDKKTNIIPANCSKCKKGVLMRLLEPKILDTLNVAHYKCDLCKQKYAYKGSN